MAQIKTPKCCGKTMELKTALYYDIEKLVTVYKVQSYDLFFQCKKCGKVALI